MVNIYSPERRGIMYQFITNSELERELYRRLKEIDDDEYWLEALMHELYTEERQRAMLKSLDEMGIDNFWDAQIESGRIARKYPNLSFPAVVREELETDLERRLYDKLIQVEDYDETWLAFIFSCIPTEELKLNLLGYLNEGHDDYAEIWEYAGLNVTKYYNRHYR